MNVVVLPGPLLCFECGGLLKTMGDVSPPNYACVVQCGTHGCKNFERPHVFPLRGTKLEQELEVSRIIQ